MLVLAMEFSRGGQRPHNAANRSKRLALRPALLRMGATLPENGTEKVRLNEICTREKYIYNRALISRSRIASDQLGVLKSK